jgi:stage III sporulation protein AG
MNNFWETDLKQVFHQLRNHPGFVWILLGLIGVGLLLMIGNDTIDSRRNGLRISQEQTVEIQPKTYQNAGVEIEQELVRILKGIDGAGVVRVEVSLKSANRKIWERQTRVSKRVSQQQGEMDTEESSSDELVFSKERDGRDSPVLKEELAPEIQGVLVVASGASDSGMKKLLTETVMTVLSLPAHRVMVIAGKDE